MNIKIINLGEEEREEEHKNYEIDLMRVESNNIIFRIKHGNRISKKISDLSKVEFTDIKNPEEIDGLTKDHSSIISLIINGFPKKVDCSFIDEKESNKKEKIIKFKEYQLIYHYGDLSLRKPTNTLEECIFPNYLSEITDLLKEFNIEPKEGKKIKIIIEEIK